MTPLEEARRLVIKIGSSILVDETQLSFGEFRAAFPAMASQRGKQGLYLRADAGVNYGAVVRVLAVMKAANVGPVGLVTEPEEIPR